MNRSTPGLPVHHQLPESTQTHVHWVSDAIQPSHWFKKNLIETDTKFVEPRGRGWGVGELGEGGQKYKLPVIRKLSSKNVQHDNYS